MENGRWESLDKFQKRLLMDIMVLDNEQFITELECTSSNFGIEGCKWLSSVLLNVKCNNINYINLSKCGLDNECIKLISQALMIKKCNNNNNSIWLDLSDNKDVDDKGVEMLMPLLFNNNLSGLHLRNTKITTKSLLLLKDYFDKHSKETNCWFIDLQNTSIERKKWNSHKIKKSLFMTKIVEKLDSWNGI